MEGVPLPARSRDTPGHTNLSVTDAYPRRPHVCYRDLTSPFPPHSAATNGTAKRLPLDFADLWSEAHSGARFRPSGRRCRDRQPDLATAIRIRETHW